MAVASTMTIAGPIGDVVRLANKMVPGVVCIHSHGAMVHRHAHDDCDQDGKDQANAVSHCFKEAKPEH